MADEIDVVPTDNGFDGSGEAMPQVSILSQYVKDLSFENPNAPASLLEATTPVKRRGAIQRQIVGKERTARA